MKKIIISLLSLIITFGLFGIGTYGVFAYPETNTDVSNNTLMLDVKKESGTVKAYTFENIKPGDSGGWNGSQSLFSPLSWTVKNTGTLDGTLEVSIENIIDNSSLLSTQIRPQIRADGVWVKESSNLGNLPVYRRNLASGEVVVIDIAWKFYESAGNEYQRASTTFDVKFFISAPSLDTPIIAPITIETTTTPFLEVAAITEGLI